MKYIDLFMTIRDLMFYYIPLTALFGFISIQIYVLGEQLNKAIRASRFNCIMIISNLVVLVLALLDSNARDELLNGLFTTASKFILTDYHLFFVIEIVFLFILSFSIQVKYEDFDLKASKKKNAQLKEKIIELEEQLIDKKREIAQNDSVHQDNLDQERTILTLTKMIEKFSSKDETDIHTS
ncbi:hypothetical protein [Vibrio mediterranei]|uniref:hypothetical protein n=1 Tax=Vibrio mediterranei TaxID=689 RepID=UPI00148E8FD8|nr:hypothetical protein [Vibrio mediterranei]NOH31002.1 hypothetical protein [Vibrio mediterranei]